MAVELEEREKERPRHAGKKGDLYRVAGPVVTAKGIQPRMYDIILVGQEELMGEVIRVVGDRSIIQVYEDTSGVRPGEPVVDTGQPLTVELGPGALGSIYDGIQRPLPVLRDKMGDYILRGVRANGLNRDREWEFRPSVKKGDRVAGGQVLGVVQETQHLEHRVLAPPNASGSIADIDEGKFRVDEPLGHLQGGQVLTLMQTWPVRRARPSKERLMPSIPLVTGQRVFDFLFPIAKGGTAAIPGGFGTGKCVVGSTPVLLADGRLVAIQELYEGARGEGEPEEPEEYLPLAQPLEILTFNGERIVPGKATAVYRGQTEYLTEVKLVSGRRVRLTPIHKLFVFDGKGLVEIPAGELKPGQRVLIAPKALYRGEAPHGIPEGREESPPVEREPLGRELGLWPEPREIAEVGGVMIPALVGGDEADHQPEFAREVALDQVLLDPVVHARTWREETEVYDLTVEETHNFVGGELPMILHNTVSQQQLAKWSDTQVVVYIGCGERGNEMTEVLTTFPELVDPNTGGPLMERTVLIANTSNMPVAAREASVYTGITIAEYFRDMGYHVSLMADSTSRWAEAMREISSRLEEMPGEEGFPAYLSARLSEFYERAGRVATLGGGEGSVSVIGAVSPSGGDMSEPVTQGTLRITKCFWALDTKLRERRHFPAINWLTSYSLYTGILEDWYRKNVNEQWPALRSWTTRILQEEAELEEIVRLVGADALPEDQQLTLEVARMVREYFLQQNAFHKVDTFAPLERQFKLMAAIKRFHDLGQRAIQLEVPLKDISGLKSRELLSRVKYEENFDQELDKTLKLMEEEFGKLGAT